MGSAVAEHCTLALRGPSLPITSKTVHFCTSGNTAFNKRGQKEPSEDSSGFNALDLKAASFK